MRQDMLQTEAGSTVLTWQQGADGENRSQGRTRRMKCTKKGLSSLLV